MKQPDRAAGLRIGVAVDVPLRRLFEYSSACPIASGSRVRVPFGSQHRVGVVVGASGQERLPSARLKPIDAVLDQEALLPREIMRLLTWAARYYHHPAGEVIATALPPALRKGRPLAPPPARWVLTAAGRGVDIQQLEGRAPRQAETLRLLCDSGTTSRLTQARLKPLLKKGWVCRQDAAVAGPIAVVEGGALQLSAAQKNAVQRVCAHLQRFSTFLLEGVTASGKTEVYFRVLERALRDGGQALLLVPEIGLTPQLLDRIQRRFPAASLVALHSGLGDAQRNRAFAAIRSGVAQLVVGTRSAVFAPFAELRLIVVDEEHDMSFKQFEGFRYSARDLAIKRAQINKIPIVLGSATPALESLWCVQRQQFTHLKLPQRAARALPPSWEVVDLRIHRPQAGLSQPLLQGMAVHLSQGHQVLLFLNRRGYAPVLICQACGWHARCPHCDANLVLHRQSHGLQCHHCGHRVAEPARCPACASGSLQPLGVGTERLEEEISKHFPDVTLLRFDRDVVRGRDAFATRMKQLARPQPAIIVGTQMMAKGHHLPGLTLVGVVDIDQALFSCDFRAGERVAQLLVQIAGRAGRGEHPGVVMLQTWQPEHPTLQAVLRDGYPGYCSAALPERKAAGFPPYTCMASLLADAPSADAARRFCQRALGCAESARGLEILGPAPASMERRAGRSHYRILCIFLSRKLMQQWLDQWLDSLQALPRTGSVHWTLDVDPQSV